MQLFWLGEYVYKWISLTIKLTFISHNWTYWELFFFFFFLILVFILKIRPQRVKGKWVPSWRSEVVPGRSSHALGCQSQGLPPGGGACFGTVTMTLCLEASGCCCADGHTGTALALGLHRTHKGERTAFRASKQEPLRQFALKVSKSQRNSRRPLHVTWRSCLMRQAKALHPLWMTDATGG